MNLENDDELTWILMQGRPWCLHGWYFQSQPGFCSWLRPADQHLLYWPHPWNGCFLQHLWHRLYNCRRLCHWLHSQTPCWETPQKCPLLHSQTPQTPLFLLLQCSSTDHPLSSFSSLDRLSRLFTHWIWNKIQSWIMKTKNKSLLIIAPQVQQQMHHILNEWMNNLDFRIKSAFSP